jgi:hypothetical protein
VCLCGVREFQARAETHCCFANVCLNMKSLRQTTKKSEETVLSGIGLAIRLASQFSMGFCVCVWGIREFQARADTHRCFADVFGCSVADVRSGLFFAKESQSRTRPRVRFRQIFRTLNRTSVPKGFGSGSGQVRTPTNRNFFPINFRGTQSKYAKLKNLSFSAGTHDC